MNPISPYQLLDLLRDTLSQCSIDTSVMSDDDISYSLFEQFDIGAQSFLHDDSLTALYREKLISEEVSDACKSIRLEWFKLTEQEWTISAIRTNPRWLALFELCSKTLEKIHTSASAED